MLQWMSFYAKFYRIIKKANDEPKYFVYFCKGTILVNLSFIFVTL